MSKLVSAEILHDILRSTGAFGEEYKSALAKGTFKPFAFKMQKREEFDFASFEDVFDQMAGLLEIDYKDNLYLDIKVKREPASLSTLNKVSFFEKSLLLRFVTASLNEPFVYLMGHDTFFQLYSRYLGGTKADVKRDDLSLTSIEIGFLKQIIDRYKVLLTQILAPLEPIEFQNADFVSEKVELAKLQKNEGLFCEFPHLIDQNNFAGGWMIPKSFLQFLKDKLEKTKQSQQKDLDPLWQKVVFNAFMNYGVDYEVKLGTFQIPFKDSVQLKVGDVLSWGKSDPRIMIRRDGVVRGEGVLGVQGENFAIKMESMQGVKL